MLQFLKSKYVIPAIFLAAISICAFGQDTTSAYNPFELRERLPEEEKVFSPPGKDTGEKKETIKDTVKKITGNPFDLPGNTGKTPQDDQGVEKNSEEAEKTIRQWTPEIPDFGSGTTISDFWIGMYILLLGVILAILNTLFSENVKKTLRAFTSFNMLNLSFRQLGEKVSNFTILIYIFYLLCGGLFIFLLVTHFKFAGLGYNLTTFVLALAFLLLINLLKHMILGISGAIFPFGKEMNLYRHTINIFDYIIGFTLFPSVIIIAFAPADISNLAVLGSIGIVLMIYLFRAIRGLTIGKKFFMFHKFHFFLYLCTVEIAPLIVTVKLLTIWGSAV